MSRKTLIGIAVTCALLGIVALLWWSSDRRTPGETGAGGADPVAKEAAGTVAAGSAALGTAPRDDIADLAGEIAGWRKLYEDQPWLTQEETVALRERRKAAAEELARRIGNSGPEIVPQVHTAIRDAPRSREKLVLMDGLGNHASAEAVDALEEVFVEEELARLKQEALRQLGNSEGEGANDLLIDQMLNSDDPALAQMAAAMLHGEAGALDSLLACVYGVQAVEIRLEAVHSIGGIGTDEAHAALDGVVSSDLEDRVKMYADKEIERSF